MIVREFTNFIREQGVVGLAVGFILGGSISKVVSSIVTDLVNPLLGILLGAFGNLEDYYWQVGGAKILYGNLLSNIINFLVVALVVYVGVRLLKLDKLDRKKSKGPQEVIIVEPPKPTTPTKPASSQKPVPSLTK